MTTHDLDKVIAAAKEAGVFNSIPLPQLLPLERFYAIAFEAGRVAGFAESIEACKEAGPKEYPNKLITDGYVEAIRARSTK